MMTAEERVLAQIPGLLKSIKKALPNIRNMHIAKELQFNTLKIVKDYKLIKKEPQKNGS